MGQYEKIDQATDQTTLCFELAKTYTRGSMALSEAKEILAFIQQRQKLNPAANLGAPAPMDGGKKNWCP